MKLEAQIAKSDVLLLLSVPWSQVSCTGNVLSHVALTTNIPRIPIIPIPDTRDPSTGQNAYQVRAIQGVALHVVRGGGPGVEKSKHQVSDRMYTLSVTPMA